MMGNKHRRSPAANAHSILAVDSIVHAQFLGTVVPRHVIANFDRWCDATASGNEQLAMALNKALRRAGYEARRIYGVGKHDVYRLRRL